MAEAFGGSVLGVRDAVWLHYRYGQKPGFEHALLCLRSRLTQTCIGVAVMRRHADHLELLDLLGEPQYFPPLIAAARLAAHAAGLPSVVTWITASHQHHLVQPGEPVLAHKLNIFVPANAHTPGLAAATLRDRWFLMAGDTDFH